MILNNNFSEGLFHRNYRWARQVSVKDVNDGRVVMHGTGEPEPYDEDILKEISCRMTVEAALPVNPLQIFPVNPLQTQLFNAFYTNKIK